MRYILRASEFFIPVRGTLRGKCVVCGFKTEKGHEIDFSENFTSWSLLQEGNCICEYCYELVKNQDYRRKSWIAGEFGVKFLKREDILSVLSSPPVPFSMYISCTGKKQGFLRIVNSVNYSKDRYTIAFDDELLYIDRHTLLKMKELAEKARKLGFSKSDLNYPSTKCWKHREICEAILKYSKNPVWGLVVYAVR